MGDTEKITKTDKIKIKTRLTKTPQTIQPPQSVKSPYDLAPIEFCRTSVKYPVDIHIFNREKIAQEEVIPRHWHQNIEITYRIRYKGEIYINGRDFPLTDDSLYIINSCDVHEIHTFPQKDMYAILISISYDFVKEAIPDIDRYVFKTGDHISEIKKIILEMKDLYMRQPDHAHVYMTSLVYRLLYNILEDAEYRSFETEASISVGVNALQAKELLKYLENHITDIHSVRELSGLLGYSREHLSRLVSSRFGITCQQLLMEIRLAYALALMKKQSYSMEQIALEAGFLNVRQFVVNFKKKYGVHPEKWEDKS